MTIQSLPVRQDAETGGVARWAVKDDPRVTRFGRFIRLTRIDEIPQLLNVLRGDIDLVGPLPQPALQSMFDALYPPGLQWYWRADFLNEISDDAIAQHIRFGEALPTMHSTMHMYPINGAAARVGKNDTAWNYRDAMWAQVIVGVDPDPANKEKIVSWTKSYYDAVHPFSAGGAYVNFLMGDEGEERVKKTYGGNYERLAKIKKKYDPDNFFRVNQNIKPS